MAGLGSRFSAAGYDIPKPFIPVHGTPMVGHVLDNLGIGSARFVLVAQRDHEPWVNSLLESRSDGTGMACHWIDGLTEGTACTVLNARALIETDSPLLIANSDQWVRHGIGAMVADARERALDGSIMVFRESGDPKWSYARCGPDGLVREVAEKVPISDLATVGIYYFRDGRDFVAAAERMIQAGDRVNGEFYTCPVYNYLIADGARVGVCEINREWMHGLGTPADLAEFLASEDAESLRSSVGN